MPPRPGAHGGQRPAAFPGVSGQCLWGSRPCQRVVCPHDACGRARRSSCARFPKCLAQLWPSSGRRGCGLRCRPAPLRPSVTHRGSGFPVKPALSPSPPSSTARPASSPPWSVSLLLAYQERVRRGPSIPRALGNTLVPSHPPAPAGTSPGPMPATGVDGGGARLHLSSEGGRPAPPLPHTQPVWVQPLRALPSEELH